MQKKEFIEVIGKRAMADAEASADDFSSVSDKEELYDIADDAWYNTAIPGLEWAFTDDPKSPYAKKGIDIHEAIEKYALSSTYKKAFVEAVIKKFKLKL
jgi:hypothetical protein